MLSMGEGEMANKSEPKNGVIIGGKSIKVCSQKEIGSGGCGTEASALCSLPSAHIKGMI